MARAAKIADKGFHHPDPITFRQTIIENRHTPDLVILEQKPMHLLFVHGSLMKDRALHKFIEYDSIYAGDAWTKKKFEMWRHKDSPTSIALPGEDSVWPSLNQGFFDGWASQKGCPPAQIRGELYIVPTETLVSIDRAWDNQVSFLRQYTPVDIRFKNVYELKNNPDLIGPMKSFTKQAFMYVGTEAYWGDRISRGEGAPCKWLRPNDKKFVDPYLYFSRE